MAHVLCWDSMKQTPRGVLVRTMLHIRVGKELGRSDPMSQKLDVRSVSDIIWVPLWGLWWTPATLTGRVLEAASLVIGDSALSKTKKLILHLPVVSRWAKNSFRVNRRQWQLVISGPPSWCDSYQMGMYWKAPVLGIEGKILMRENLLGASY